MKRLLNLWQWLRGQKSVRYGCRPATLDDLAFIRGEIEQSVNDGHYRDTLLHPVQLAGWMAQLGNVIRYSWLERYADQRDALERIQASLWVYGTASDDQIGYMLVAERFPGSGDVELELYQAGVRKDRRGLGHGRRLVAQFTNCAPSSVTLYARCLRPSDGMVRLLVSAGFDVIGTTARGTRELARKGT